MLLYEYIVETTGKHSINISLNKTEQLHIIHVKSNKYLIPASINDSNDNRKLSYKIHKEI
jgi:hypothetical protein